MAKYFLFILSAILIFSCKEETNPIENQETIIKNYITNRIKNDSILELKQEGGVNYLYRPGDTTINASRGDSVFLFYVATLVSDTSFYFDTNILHIAQAMGLTITDSSKYDTLKVVVGNNNLIHGLRKGLELVHLHDTGEIIFNSDYGFGDGYIGIVPSNSALRYKITVPKIVKNK